MQLLDQIQELSGTRSQAVPQPPSPAPVSVPAAPVKLAELQPSSPAVSSPQSSFSVPAEPSSPTNWMPLPETSISTVSLLQFLFFQPSPFPPAPCPAYPHVPLGQGGCLPDIPLHTHPLLSSRRGQVPGVRPLGWLTFLTEEVITLMTTMTFPNIVMLPSMILSDLLFFAILFRCLVFAFCHLPPCIVYSI